MLQYKTMWHVSFLTAFECGKVTSCHKNDLGLCPYFIYEPKHCLCLLRENKRKTNRFIYFFFVQLFPSCLQRVL